MLLLDKGITLSGIWRRIRSDCFLLFTLGTVYVVIVSSLAISGHYGFETNAWDLGIYSQALYTTLNHHGMFYYTAELPGNPSGSLFGIHFSPILFLLIPVYAIFQSPITLLVLRPVAIAVGLIPLYWIAREQIDNRGLVFLLAIIYLVYPPVLIPIFNFDVEVFLPAFFLFSLYYLGKEKFLHASFFIVLALMVNEFVPLIVVALAVYLFVLRRRSILEELKQRRLTKSTIFAIVLLFGGVLWFIMASGVIAYFNPTALSTKWEWGEFGTGPCEIVINVLTNPFKTVDVLFTDGGRKFLYLASLLAPLGFFSLMNPLPLIMALPWLGASFLSINPLYYDIRTQYPAFVSPFIFVSAIYGLKSIMNTAGKELSIRLSSVMIVSLLLTTLLFPASSYFSVTEADEATRVALSMIPQSASASVMPELYPHLCNRLEIYPYFQTEVDYVLINVYSWWYTVTLPRPAHVAPRWCDAEIGEEYGIVVNSNGVVLYRKGYKGRVAHFESVHFKYTSFDVQIATGKIVQDPVTEEPVLVHQVNHSTPLFFEVPEKVYPPGSYNVTVVLKVASITPEHVATVEITEEPEHSMIVAKKVEGDTFIEAGKWQVFELNFTIEDPTSIQIDAYVTNSTDVYFDYINVLQVSGDR